MANNQTWHCAVCGSTNTIADAECETCKSPRETAGKAFVGGVARGVRVEASRDAGPNSPYAAMMADPGPSEPYPSYRPAGAAAEATVGRTAVGWLAGLAIVAGLYFLYQYTQNGTLQTASAPPVAVGPQTSAPAAPATAPTQDYANWAASATLDQLRAAISGGGANAPAARTELTAREDVAWTAADADGSIERVAAFLTEWPNGQRTGVAREKLQRLIGGLPAAPFTRRVVSPTRAAMREAPSANARVTGYIEANAALTPRRSVRNGSQWWFALTDENGRPGYVAWTGFRYADPPPAPPQQTTPPPVRTPPPRIVTAPPPTAPPPAAPRQAANVREASPASAIRIEYPSRARGNETGRVEVEFIVTVSGAVPADFITVISETPAGRGFGEAVVQGLSRARYTPRSVNGTPEPSRVRRSFTIAPP